MAKKTILIIVGVIIAVILGELGYRYWASHNVTVHDEAMAMEQTPPTLDEPKVMVEGTPEPTEASEETIEQAIKEQLASQSEDMADQARFAAISFAGDAAQALSIGDDNAPLTIVEYSSLSCPHCGFFHKTTLPQLVKNYVDTGKARIVFQDFPLNKKAFDATMVNRCMPAEKRYSFMNLLFATMNDWLAADDHVQALSQYAVIEGMDNEALATCMNRQDVAESVIEGARQASEKHQIKSTPSFVINDGALILSGSLPYSEFSRQLDELLAGNQ